jgi:hypothetical protein
MRLLTTAMALELSKIADHTESWANLNPRRWEEFWLELPGRGASCSSAYRGFNPASEREAAGASLE